MPRCLPAENVCVVCWLACFRRLRVMSYSSMVGVMSGKIKSGPGTDLGGLHNRPAQEERQRGGDGGDGIRTGP